MFTISARQYFYHVSVKYTKWKYIKENSITIKQKSPVDFVQFCHYRDNDTRSTFRYIRYPGNQGIFVIKAYFDVVFNLLIINN